MIKSHVVDKLAIIEVATSDYHDVHLRTLRRYISLSKLSIVYLIPAFAGLLQLKIVKKVGGLEYAISEGEKRLKKLSKQLPQASNKREIQLKIKAQKVHALIHKHLIKEWKWVVDGIAFRIFDFNINKLSILSEKETTGSLQFTGKGFQNELAEFKKVAIVGNKLSILAEITNWIRVCDIVIFNKKSISLVEVKSSKQSLNGRIDRQQQRLKQITNILNKNYIDTNQGRVVFKNLDLPVKTHLKKVHGLIKKVSTGKVCAEHIRLDGVISVTIRNYGRAIKFLPKEMTEKDLDAGSLVLEDTLSCPGPEFEEENKPNILTVTNYDHFSQSRGEFVRLVPPYTIYPFSSKICSEIISGKILVTTFVDTGAIKAIFESDGWIVERISNSVLGNEISELKSEKRSSSKRHTIVKDDTFFILRKKGEVVHFPFSIIIKMAYEFYTAEFLCDIANEMSIFNSADGSKYGSFIHFQKQREIWR